MAQVTFFFSIVNIIDYSFEDKHTVGSKIVNVFTKPQPQSQLSREVQITAQHFKVSDLCDFNVNVTS